MSQSQGVLYKIALLVLLSSVQPGQLQEEPTANEGGDLCSVFDDIKSLLSTIKRKTDTHIGEFRTFRDQVEGSLMSLRDDLSSLNDSVRDLSTDLQEHKQEVAADLSQIPTSHTQESLQLYKNLTYQLENIQRDVKYILGPYTCGGTGGWRRVVYLDMTDPNTTCPSGWQLTGYSKRTCGRATNAYRTCDSVMFPVSGGEYSRVCGRIKAYQWGNTPAFLMYNAGREKTINHAYVSGISITRSSPREHIWTFASGAAEGDTSPYQNRSCPCDADYTLRVPPFVGGNYFCESGVNEAWSYTYHYTLHSNDTLWDGQNCLSTSTCCSLCNPPYFVKQMPTSTTDDIEARICLYAVKQFENIAVELIELYVQ